MEFNGFDSLDLSNVESAENYLRAGQYRCEVTKATVEQTKTKNGQYVMVEMKCLDGNGKTVDRFNVKNPNPKAVQIGLEKLKKFLIDAQHPNPNRPGDINSLTGLKVVVNLKPGDSYFSSTGEELEGRGEIVGYVKDSGQMVAGVAVDVPPAAPMSQPSHAGADAFGKDDIPF